MTNITTRNESMSSVEHIRLIKGNFDYGISY